jgi:hypothetical protein
MPVFGRDLDGEGKVKELVNGGDYVTAIGNCK